MNHCTENTDINIWRKFQRFAVIRFSVKKTKSIFLIDIFIFGLSKVPTISHFFSEITLKEENLNIFFLQFFVYTDTKQCSN